MLGLTRQSNYEQAVIPLQGGEMLVAFTDGIAETTDADDIAGYLREHTRVGARDLVMGILQEASSIDDRTAVAARIGKTEEQAPLMAIASWERERIAEGVAA